MSPRYNMAKRVPRMAAVHADEDLTHDLKRASRKRRVLSWIVLMLLLMAFVISSVLQVMPFLAPPPGKEGANQSPLQLALGSMA
ncbi:MAG: hypothetical protein KGR26_12240 [Cyanobacteria bacterium REEB65]|nr:hypothetical protein [Cyanobacteria bacterium REEB65]